MVDVRVGDHRVLGHDIHSFDLSILCLVEHLHDGKTDFVRQRYTPCLLKLLLAGFKGDRLVAGVDVGHAAHVARALDVNLTAQRVDPAAGHSHVAQQHLKIGRGEDVLVASGVLGDAHGVQQRPRTVLGQHVRRLDDLLRGDAAYLRRPLRRVLYHLGLELLKALGALSDELLVV